MSSSSLLLPYEIILNEEIYKPQHRNDAKTSKVPQKGPRFAQSWWSPASIMPIFATLVYEQSVEEH